MRTTDAMSFDAIAVGAQWRSPGRTVTEADLVQSCMTSGDWHPIHADAEFAASTPMGQRIFHGTWGVHIALGMATPFPPLGDLVVGALGLSDWRYEAPLRVGDTVHVDVEIAGKRRTGSGARGILERRIRLIRHDGTVVQQGVAASMVKVPRAGAAEASA
jgi:acyl dehydratase